MYASARHPNRHFLLKLPPWNAYSFVTFAPLSSIFYSYVQTLVYPVLFPYFSCILILPYRQNWHLLPTHAVAYADPKVSLHAVLCLLTWVSRLLCYTFFNNKLLIHLSFYPCKWYIMVNWIYKVYHQSNLSSKVNISTNTSLFWRLSEVEGIGSTVFPGHTAIWLTASLFLKAKRASIQNVTILFPYSYLQESNTEKIL